MKTNCDSSLPRDGARVITIRQTPKVNLIIPIDIEWEERRLRNLRANKALDKSKTNFSIDEE